MDCSIIGGNQIGLFQCIPNHVQIGKDDKCDVQQRAVIGWAQFFVDCHFLCQVKPNLEDYSVDCNTQIPVLQTK